ncbi:MAG: VOC family protein [Calditrichaeota bacterium]|nr:MAG: VOC family protein [Calditrichota bacterium]
MKLNQITLPAIDIVKSTEFYKTLGFRQIVDSEHYARFQTPFGDTTLSLHQVDSFTPNEWMVIYLETNELDSVYTELSNKLTFDTPPTDMPWLWREARLTDPTGNRICLYYAGENRINPPWRIKD